LTLFPSDTPFLQQKLVGYRPLLTLRVGLVIIGILEVFLIVYGCLLFLSINSAKEHIIDYTNCTHINSTDENYFVSDGVTSRLNKFDDYGNGKIKCSYIINLTAPFNGTVRFYYGMDNFYQNMRLYFRSRNDEQLQGKNLGMVEDCQPKEYQYANDTHWHSRPIAPCGAVANSFFNDTFNLTYQINDTWVLVPWTTSGLMDDNVKTKYQNPRYPKTSTLCEAFANTMKPPNWPIEPCNMNDSDGKYGFENFDFMVWMQTAALPHFRKIYRQLDTGHDVFHDGLPNGIYILEINYNYPVKEFRGNKKFIIAIESPMGTKNYFLPMVYLSTAVGLFFATIFLCVVSCCPCAGLDTKLRQVAKHF
jgi:hypothetical protein